MSEPKKESDGEYILPILIKNLFTMFIVVPLYLWLNDIVLGNPISEKVFYWESIIMLLGILGLSGMVIRGTDYKTQFPKGILIIGVLIMISGGIIYWVNAEVLIVFNNNVFYLIILKLCWLSSTFLIWLSVFYQDIAIMNLKNYTKTTIIIISIVLFIAYTIILIPLYDRISEINMAMIFTAGFFPEDLDMSALALVIGSIVGVIILIILVWFLLRKYQYWDLVKHITKGDGYEFEPNKWGW